MWVFNSLHALKTNWNNFKKINLCYCFSHCLFFRYACDYRNLIYICLVFHDFSIALMWHLIMIVILPFNRKLNFWLILKEINKVF